MIDNLAYEYIDNIPWNDDPAFAFSNDADAYLSAFKSAVEQIPIADGRVSFLNDIWDFTQYFKNVTDDKMTKFSFEDFPSEIRTKAKFFVLYCITGKKKISTTFTRTSMVKGGLKSILEDTNNTTVYTITTDDIIKYIKDKNASASTEHNNYESFYQFYCFLIHNYKLDLPVDTEKLKNLGIKSKNLSKATQDEDKIPNIPEEYFNKILNKALVIMEDKSRGYNTRATACMIVILSQLGLRSGDLLCLQVNQLFEKNLLNIGKIANYVHYKSIKPSKPHSPLLEFDIYCTPTGTKAFRLLKKLRKKCELSEKTDFLYVLDPTPNSKDTFPIKQSRFQREYKRFIFEYLGADALRTWDGVEPNKYVYWDKYKKELVTAMVYIPDTRQYRVHLCTSLYNQGVSLVFIQKYMGHLSEYMLGYYVRPKDTFQEDLSYSEKFIKEVAADDVTPLGGDNKGSEIKKSIQDFIAKNNFNVQTDIDAIVNALGDKVIVRGKTGGVCIKASLMPCARDTRTNNFMCAYNICPNLFHMYYMADISYSNFRHLQETYNALVKNGNKMAAQKEYNKLHDIAHRKLLPELDALDYEISRRGVETIIENYPNLLDIINNEGTIRKEIESWMNR